MMERQFQEQIQQIEEEKRQREQQLHESMVRQPEKPVDEMSKEEREAYMEQQMDKIMATKLGLNQISPQGRGLQNKKRYETPGFNNNIDRRETPDLAPQPVIVLD